MEKAYDFKVLGESLKAKGLIQGEEMVEDVIKELFVWLKESAVLSKSPYDDLAVIIYPQVESMMLAQADKISDHDNE